MGAVRGLDISACQGTNVRWDLLVADGIAYCWARCQVGNNVGRDALFAAYVDQMLQAGIIPGCYQFPFPLAHLDPLAQAEGFAQAALVGSDKHPLGSMSRELPPAYDLEWPPPDEWAKRGETADSICDWSIACLERMTFPWGGVAPVIYSYPYFLQALAKAKNYAELVKYKLWIAGGATYMNGGGIWPDPPKPPIVPGWGDDWTFNQWDGNGGKRLPGTGVDADFDLYRYDLDALRALCRANPPAPTPELDPVVIAAQASNLSIDDAVTAYRDARAQAMIDQAA